MCVRACVYLICIKIIEQNSLFRSIPNIHLCMYVCTYVRMYVCMYVCVYECSYLYVHTISIPLFCLL